MSFAKSNYNENGEKLCPICNTYQPMSEYYWCEKENRPYSYCKPCQRQSTKKKQRQCKQEAVDYKGGKCEKCGYNKCLGALEFHHLDPNEKDNNFGSLYKNYQYLPDKAKIELDKCILVCTNCHREEHEKINNAKSI